MSGLRVRLDVRRFHLFAFRQLAPDHEGGVFGVEDAAAFDLVRSELDACVVPVADFGPFFDAVRDLVGKIKL